MRRDKNAPALYELIGGRPPAPPPTPIPPAPRPGYPSSTPAPAPARSEPPVQQRGPISASTSDGASWFGPGRAVRLPVGYLVMAGLLVLVLLVGAYSTGYRAHRAEIDQLRQSEAARELDGTVDPLSLPAQTTREPARSTTQQVPPPARSTQPRQQTQNPAPTPNRVPEVLTPRNNPNTIQKSGVIIVTGKRDDPRQSGLNYLITATLPVEEAEKAAQFLASKGLEIAVVPVDNRPSFRWVVILQGVAGKDVSGTQAKALEYRLQEFGREYRDVHKGPTVFNDPWWKKYTN